MVVSCSGGSRVVEGFRQVDKKGPGQLVGGETDHTYKRWKLSKQVLRDKTPALKKLPCLEERWFDSHKIETRFGTVVTQFNIDRRLAVLGNGETIEFKKAWLALCSRPVRPQVAGVGLGHGISLRTYRHPQDDALKAAPATLGSVTGL